MVVSNSPFENPFTRRRVQPSPINTRCKELPQSCGQQQQLTVPHQDIPYGDTVNSSVGQFITANVFRLSDGTLVDFANLRIIRQSNAAQSAYWGNPTATIRHPYDVNRQHSTNQQMAQEFTSMIASPEGWKMKSELDPLQMLNPNELEYWIKAKEETEKMIDNMTDDQKKLIADFEAHFPKSRLIEENLKIHQTKTIRL